MYISYQFKGLIILAYLILLQVNTQSELVPCWDIDSVKNSASDLRQNKAYGGHLKDHFG